MQLNTLSPQHVRNSYGYTFQDTFQSKTPQSKCFPTHLNYFPTQNHNEKLASSIRNITNKPDFKESPNQKQPTPGEGSPTLLSYSPFSQNKFKPQFASNSDSKAQQQMNDSVLRLSYSKVLKRFDSSINLGNNIRSTANFNIGNRQPPGFISQMIKKSSEKYNNPKNILNFKQNQQPQLQVPTHTHTTRPTQKFRNTSNLVSKTPPKFFGQKRKDGTPNKGSYTPIKHQILQENSNENSGISRIFTQVEEKKVFKSLNQIVETKAKEKLVCETSRTTIKKQSKMINGFEIGSVLGKGKFGEVFLARHHQLGFFVAMKKIAKAKVAQFKMLNQLSNEISLHSCLDHPNIVRFFGYFQTHDQIYLTLEYINGGTLFDYLNQVNHLTVRQAVQYLRDIIQAVVYMHQKAIAHRDIKPQNVVITSEGVAKLCDFGWAALVQTSRKTYCGTFDYVPPQILQRKNYDTSVDVWCIGILTYELLTGRVPFEGEEKRTVMQKILNVDKNKIEYPVDIPAEAKQFIEALVQKDPNLRPKGHDLLKFKLFNLYPPKHKNKTN